MPRKVKRSGKSGKVSSRSVSSVKNSGKKVNNSVKKSGGSVKNSRKRVNKLDNSSLTKRPNSVFYAVILLFITLLVGVVRSFFELSSLGEEVSIAFVIVIQLFVLMILALFFYMIWIGKNWARITLLVFFVIGIIFYVDSVFNVIMNYSVLKVFDIFGFIGFIQIVLQLTALILLFSKSSSLWFRGLKNR
jgi:hypothetical protein